MARVRLCDEDRERFGTAEWLNIDLRDISVDDMGFLVDRFGFDPDDWPRPFFGELTLDQAGDPDAVPKAPTWRNHAYCWMLLRQNGIQASWEDAGTVRYLRLEFAPDPPASPGKEATVDSPSPDSDASTTPPSTTSTV